MTAQPFDRKAAKRALNIPVNMEAARPLRDSLRAALARIDEQAEGLADRDARLKEIARLARFSAFNADWDEKFHRIRALASGEKSNG